MYFAHVSFGKARGYKCTKVNCVSLKVIFRSYPLGPVVVILFKNRDFVEVIKLRSYWLKVVPNPMAGILIRRKHRDTPGGERGRDCSNAATTSQGTPGIASILQKLGETYETDTPSEFPEGTNPANTLILEFQPLEQ